MPRKRVTQIFPFLLPLRKAQRKMFYYIKMRWDHNQYAQHIMSKKLPYTIYSTKALLLNTESGFDMKYQYNKVHNLKLAAKTINHIMIHPGETFSFWWLVRAADKSEKYKEGLLSRDGVIVPTYGGGLCQLSNLLFELFLHSPFIIVERHGHSVESFPTEGMMSGTDATVSEGWRDLKVRNDTNVSYQLEIQFDEEHIYGILRSEESARHVYEVFQRNQKYYKTTGKIFEKVSIWQKQTDCYTGEVTDRWLYDHVCEIGYELPDEIKREMDAGKKEEGSGSV